MGKYMILFEALLLVLFSHLTRVVQSLDNAIHWINRDPVEKSQSRKHAVRWIVIYPVDSVIHLSNNPAGQGPGPRYEIMLRSDTGTPST